MFHQVLLSWDFGFAVANEHHYSFAFSPVPSIRQRLRAVEVPEFAGRIEVVDQSRGKRFEPTGLHYPGGLNEAGRGSMVFNAYRLPLKARRAASQAPPRLLR